MFETILDPVLFPLDIIHTLHRSPVQKLRVLYGGEKAIWSAEQKDLQASYHLSKEIVNPGILQWLDFTDNVLRNGSDPCPGNWVFGKKIAVRVCL